MHAVPETIEAEVLEIDGQRPAPAPPQQERASSASAPWGRAWSSLGGRVLKLDRRWWPLWVLLGIAAVVVLGVVTCVAAVVFTAFRILGGIVRLLTGSPRSSSGASLVRRGG